MLVCWACPCCCPSRSLAARRPTSCAAVDPLANPAAVTAERLLDAGNSTQWLTYGGSYSEQRFSPLKQIDTTNVGTLGLAWFADYDTNLDQHGTPLYVDGVLYVSTAWNKLYAFDAKTGKQLWQYNAKVPGEWLRNVCCGNVNRGIAAYNGKIYMGTLDARLVAIDAKTGKEAWATDTIEGDHNDPLNRFSITMAPRIAKGKVFIGASGGEFGVRGWIAAFDAETGKEVWRFYNVPGDPAKGFENEAMKKAAATWSGEWWKIGGGGTVWDATIYDPVTDLLIYGTGNGTPWNQMARDPKRRRQPLCRLHHRAEGRHRRIRLALPDHAGRHLGLRRGQPDDDGRPHDRWQAAACADPAEQERLPLCARCRRRQAAQRRCVHRSELGHRRRHEDGPSEGGAGRAL